MSWRRKWQPTPVFLPGEFHGQRSLAGYSPWNRRELDLNERLSDRKGNVPRRPKIQCGLPLSDSPLSPFLGLRTVVCVVWLLGFFNYLFNFYCGILLVYSLC